MIEEGVELGDCVEIGPYVVIGTDPEHIGSRRNGPVVIGNGTVIREHSVIHAPRGTETRIGAGVYICSGVYVGHDATVGDDCILYPRAVLGGHAVIQDSARVGAGAMVHQYARVGKYAMVGANSYVRHAVRPWMKAVGNPTREIGRNAKLQPEEDLGRMWRAWKGEDMSGYRSWLADLRLEGDQ